MLSREQWWHVSSFPTHHFHFGLNRNHVPKLSIFSPRSHQCTVPGRSYGQLFGWPEAWWGMSYAKMALWCSLDKWILFIPFEKHMLIFAGKIDDILCQQGWILGYFYFWSQRIGQNCWNLAFWGWNGHIVGQTVKKDSCCKIWTCLSAL